MMAQVSESIYEKETYENNIRGMRKHYKKDIGNI